MQIGLGIGTTFRQKWVPSLTEQIRSLLFAASEQGVFYDPSDLSTMYQDAAGTTPVYMPGQGQVDPPVGLLLDKRLGLTRGPELWVDASVQLFGEASRVAPGVYRVYTSAGAYTAVQISGLTAGEWYELSLNVDLITTLGNGLACDVTTPVVSFNSVGPKKYLLRTNTNVIAIKRNANVLTDIQISSVSVRRIPGNHAYQTTATSRPTLSARYNLLTNTNWSGAVVGAPGTAPTGWSAKFSTAAITGVSQLGNDYAIQLTASAQQLFFTQEFSAAANTTYSLSCLVVENAGVPIEQMLGFTGVPAGATLQWYVNGVASTNGVFPAAGARIELRLVNGSTTGTPAARVGIGCAVNTTGVVGLAQPDVRVTGDGVGLPTYQRVVDANTYDTTGFPLYLKFDGVDDWMQTANVDFSGTDVVAIVTAYRKMSDVSIGELFALSGNPTANAGTFGFYAPETPGGVAAAVLFARGASSTTSGQRLGTAPISCVAGGWASLSMPYMRYRINQGVSLTSSAATGGGNYGNYPLFIGRRNGTHFPFNGRLYSLLIRGAATPDDTIAKVERYLNQKAKVF